MNLQIIKDDPPFCQNIIAIYIAFCKFIITQYVINFSQEFHQFNQRTTSSLKFYDCNDYKNKIDN